MEEHVRAWVLILIYLPSSLIRFLGHFLPRGLLAQILDAALEMDLETYVQILTSLAPHVSYNLRNKALRAFKLKRDPRIIKSLAPYLTTLQRCQALNISMEIDDSTIRAEIIAILAPYLDNPRPKTSIYEALDITYYWPKRLIYEALDITLSIKNASACAKALYALAPRFTKELASRALAKISEIQEEDSLALALRTLISGSPPDNLSRELLIQAMEIAVKIKNADACVKVLDTLIPNLPQDLRDRGRVAKVSRLTELGHNKTEPDHYRKALEVIKEIKNEVFRIEALTGLARYLPTELIDEALTIAQEIRDELGLAEALVTLSPRLPSNLLPEALILATKIGSRDARAKALAALAPCLAELPSRDLYPLWDETLQHLACRTRDDLITDLKALEPIIRALGGEEAITKTQRAIQDVQRWWP
jgi:hypothetical protein